MIEEMRKTAMQVAKASGGKQLKVGGKRLDEINSAEDLQNIGMEQLEKARQDLVQKDRAEKIRQRKLESKRCDHMARALREEESKVIQEWADKTEEADVERYLAFEADKHKAARDTHEENMKLKALLQQFKA